MSIKIKLTDKITTDEKFKTEPKINIRILTQTPIILSFCSEQVFLLTTFLGSFDKILTLVENFDIRPKVTPMKNPTLWFQYLAKAVMKENKEKYRLFFRCEKNEYKLFDMFEYIALYKRVQTFIKCPWVAP